MALTTQLTLGGAIHGLTVSPVGHLILSVDHALVECTEGIASQVLLAGSLQLSGFEDGQRINKARFRTPSGMAWYQGCLFICDRDNHRIRVLEEDLVSTYAGGDTQGFKDGDKKIAQLSEPEAIAVLDQNIFVVERGRSSVRLINPSGFVSTLAVVDKYDQTTPISSLTASDGHLYCTNLRTQAVGVLRLGAEMNQKTQNLPFMHYQPLTAMEGSTGTGITSANNGILFVVSEPSGRVVQVDPTGQVYTLVSGKTLPSASSTHNSPTHSPQADLYRGDPRPLVALSPASGSLFWATEGSSAWRRLTHVVSPQNAAVRLDAPGVDSFLGLGTLFMRCQRDPSSVGSLYRYNRDGRTCRISECVLSFWFDQKDVSCELLVPAVSEMPWISFILLIVCLHGHSALLHTPLTDEHDNLNTVFDVTPTALNWAHVVYHLERLESSMKRATRENLLEWAYHRLWVTLSTAVSSADEAQALFRNVRQDCHGHDKILQMIANHARQCAPICAEIFQTLASRDPDLIERMLDTPTMQNYATGTTPSPSSSTIEDMDALIFPFQPILDWAEEQASKLHWVPLDDRLSLSTVPSYSSPDWILSFDGKTGVLVHSWFLSTRWAPELKEAPAKRTCTLPSELPRDLVIPILRYAYTGRVMAADIPMNDNSDSLCRYAVSARAKLLIDKSKDQLFWRPFIHHCRQRLISNATLPEASHWKSFLKDCPEGRHALDLLQGNRL